MNIQNKTKFNWDLEDHKWSNLDFVLGKFAHYNKSEMIKSLPFVTGLWTNETFINKLIEYSLIDEVFKICPVLSSWEEQSILEEKLLNAIKDEDTLDQVWNHYLNFSYIYTKQDNDYHQLLKDNQNNVYAGSIIDYITIKQKVSKKFIDFLFNNDIQETKFHYQKVINFIEKNIFTGNIYKNFINDSKNSLPLSLKFKKILLGDTRYNEKTYNFFRGSLYPHLPYECMYDRDYIYTYLHHIGQCNRRARDSVLFNKTDIEQNRKYNNTNINAVPLIFFNNTKEIANYYLNVAVTPMVIDRDVTIPDLKIFNNSEILKSYKDRENFWQDLLYEVIVLNNKKVMGLWNFFIPEEKKSDPTFIISVLDIYTIIESQFTNSTNYDEKNKLKTLFRDIEFINKDLYEALPVHLQENVTISKKYLTTNGNIENVKSFPLELFDINKDKELIKRVISKQSFFDYIYQYNKKNTNDEETVRIKNKETVEIWKQDIELMVHCKVSNINYLQVCDGVWEKWLSLPDKLNQILAIHKNMFSLLPEKYYTKEIVLYCMNHSINLPKNMEHIYWEDEQYCLEACKINNNYIENIPDEHWNDKKFIKEIFALIDSIDKTIIKEIINKTPIFIQQFLHDHEVQEDYSRFLNSYMLKHSIETEVIEIVSPMNQKKLKI